MPSIRVRVSRAISRVVLGRQGMFCAWESWFRWPIRHVLNALFLDARHCDAMADWEASTAPDEMAEFRATREGPEALRRAGLI